MDEKLLDVKTEGGYKLGDVTYGQDGEVIAVDEDWADRKSNEAKY